MTSPSSVAISAVDLVKSFKDVQALAGVSFEVPTGSVLGLLGPNGAGKTTAVRILTTTLLPDSGAARVNGFDVCESPQQVRRSIGLAGQYAAVDENLTGRENLTLVGRLNHLSKPTAAARALELLDQFHLTDAANRPVRTYSGGMRRRLDLGAALVTHPPILMLDEPTTGLDPASRQDLWEVIGNLVADGTTVLLTTQYLEEADRLADRIIVIDHGLIVAEGTASELKSSLGETTVVLTFADSMAVDAAVTALAAHRPSRLTSDVNALAIPLRGGPATVRDVLNQLADAGVAAQHIDLHAPTLDDVFLSLTGATP